MRLLCTRRTEGNPSSLGCADSQGRARVPVDRRPASARIQAGTSQPPQPPGMGVSPERDGPSVHQPQGTLCVTDTLPAVFFKLASC